MRLADKVATMARRGEPLPYDAEVEYLESTGTQYIDTGLRFNSRFSFSLTAKYTGYQNLANIQLFGYRDSAIKNCVNVFYDWSNYAQVFCNLNNGSYDNRGWMTWERIPERSYEFFDKIKFYGSLKERSIYDVDLNKALASNNVVERWNFITPGTLYLFHQNGNPTSQKKFTGRVYDLTINDGDEFVLDYKPVRIGQVGYMYDRVSGQFFSNAGTGAFIIGPDKT